MKRLFALLILVMLFIPFIPAQEAFPNPASINVRDEIQKKLDAVDIENSVLPKIGFLLPVMIEIRTTDTDEVYYIEVSKERISLIDDPERESDLVIRATSTQIISGFSSGDNFGGIISEFTFEPQSFKGSLLTVALEEVYGTELLPDHTFSQKVMRWVVGWFV